MTGIELALGGAFAFGVGGYLATVLEWTTASVLDRLNNRKQSKKSAEAAEQWEDVIKKARAEFITKQAQRVIALDDTHPLRQAWQDAAFSDTSADYIAFGRAMAAAEMGEEAAQRYVGSDVAELNGRDVVAEVERISTLSSVEDFMRGGE